MATRHTSQTLRILRFLAFAATLLGGYHLVSTALVFNKSFSAQGIVLDFAPTNEAFAPDRTPIIGFVDYRNEKWFGAPESALGSSDAIIGQEIAIRYSPEAPEAFRLDTVLGLWGSGVRAVLYGLVPYLFMTIFMASPGKSKPSRPPSKKRESTLNVSHMVDHSQITNDTDKPVVRRMR